MKTSFLSRHRHVALSLALGLCAAFSARADKIAIDPPPVPDALRNPWPAEWETKFQERAQGYLSAAKSGGYGNNYFENEKRSYPKAMCDFLKGNREPALKFLQSEDADASSHEHTLGIDFYPCFTLKGQVRKYFQFGPYLDPAYKKRMFDGAKVWTEKDPLHRLHPKFGKGKGGEGWTAEIRGGWVDSRNTDNLRAMRDTSAYLFAEETGNKETQQIFRKRLQTYVASLYKIGMGEWDSANYLGHTMSAYINLYDFAKDPEVTALAKSACDWLSAAAAMKYWRGGYAGPNKRDYGGTNRLHGSGAGNFFELWFNDCPLPNPHLEVDGVHIVLSAYRPPVAVVALAHKDFKKPVEVFATKPKYENERGADKLPESWETMFYGNTFQIGSLVSAGPIGDANAFGMMAFNSKNGVDFFLANTMPVVGHQGKNAGDQIAQNRNLVLWLRAIKEPKTFEFLAPKGAVEKDGDIWFVKMEKTWLAIRPIHLADFSPRDVMTTPKPSKKEPNPQPALNPEFSGAQVLSSATTAGAYAGFALEVGEEPMKFEQFKEAVKKKGRLDLAALESGGTAELTGSDGRTLKLTYNTASDLPVVVRDGKPRDWQNELDLWKPVDGTGPISLGWKQGTLRIEAGGKIFEETLSAEGKATFSEKAAR